MNTSLRLTNILFLALLAVVPLQLHAQKADAQKADAQKIARGKYLVEEVAKCQKCHTPADDHGQPDRARWLQGGPVPIQPARPTADWAYEAPKIAGLPGWNDADAIRFLQTGITASGYRARPPMNEYKLPRADAEAIVAYLRSLRSEPW
jgi:mono/diheme cytochrome c family protein